MRISSGRATRSAHTSRCSATITDAEKGATPFVDSPKGVAPLSEFKPGRIVKQDSERRRRQEKERAQQPHEIARGDVAEDQHEAYSR